MPKALAPRTITARASPYPVYGAPTQYADDGHTAVRPNVQSASHTRPGGYYDYIADAQRADAQRAVVQTLRTPSEASETSEEDQDEEVDPYEAERQRRLNLNAPLVNLSIDRARLRPNQDKIGYLLRIKCYTGLFPIPMRILRVPSTVTFHRLHLILQTAFDYPNCALHHFKMNVLRQPGDPRKTRYPPDPTEVMTIEEAISPDHRDFLRPEELQRLQMSREVKLWQVYENAEWRARGVVGWYRYDRVKFEIQLMGQAESTLGKAVGKREDQEISCLAGEACAIHEHSDSVDREQPWRWDVDEVNKELKKLQRLKVYTKQEGITDHLYGKSARR